MGHFLALKWHLRLEGRPLLLPQRRGGSCGLGKGGQIRFVPSTESHEVGSFRTLARFATYAVAGYIWRALE